MDLIIVGVVVALSSIQMMRASSNEFGLLGMLTLIVGVFLIKKGRDKIKRN